VGWRRTSIARVALCACLLLVGVVAGILTLRAEHHFRRLYDAGATLNGAAELLADGPSALTAWPGWVAAAAFALALRRVSEDGPPEPPPTSGAAVQTSVADIRATLRKEHRWVRLAMGAVMATALIDSGRLVAFIGASFGDASARGGLVALSAEAAGLALAAAILFTWVQRFGRQLEVVGAL